MVAAHHWGKSPANIAEGYDLSERQVNECLAFYDAHRAEIDAAIQAEEALAP